MTEQEFFELARQGYNRIPLVREMPADLDTPLSVYLKLANAPYSYLLESVVGGERFGRYSFIGLPARTVLRVRNHLLTVETDGRVVEEHTLPDPLAFIADFQARFKAAPVKRLPRFTGGLAGYFGYDTIRYIEKRLAATRKEDVLHTPDILLMLTEELAVFDNLAGKLYLITHADPMQANAYASGHLRLAALAEKLHAPVQLPPEPQVSADEPQSEFGEAEFKAAVQKAKDYIGAGDIMQVVLSQRMSRPFSASPLSLYRALRSLNPSPYMFYYDFGGFHVVGSSPEILVRLEGDTVTLRPIAGTRPRGLTREDDQRLADELLADPKECAEHLQLLDLGRNDTGRVAVTGSVKVTENMTIERYSHVMHIVSNVEGRLSKKYDTIDALVAGFPAGTVSGAPKVRAMEIIDELEKNKRGVYAGCVGYFSADGEMDTCIVLRTAIVKDGKMYVQAGAGVVADSVPESEHQECVNKAKALFRAAEEAVRFAGRAGRAQ
jgi:anthranilate synthase component 1